MTDLNLTLTVEETKGVLEALQRFPMNQVRPLVTKIEAQATAQLAPKPAGPTTAEAAAAAVAEVLNEVNPPKGPAVNG